MDIDVDIDAVGLDDGAGQIGNDLVRRLPDVDVEAANGALGEAGLRDGIGDGARVHLTGKEYAMLELLSLRKGTTLTKEMFLNHLYGGMDEPELKIIDVFICKLRKKLANASEGRNFIETVWGRGYVLREPHEVEERIPA